MKSSNKSNSTLDAAKVREKPIAAITCMDVLFDEKSTYLRYHLYLIILSFLTNYIWFSHIK